MYHDTGSRALCVFDTDGVYTNCPPTAPLQGQEGLFIEDISNPQSPTKPNTHVTIRPITVLMFFFLSNFNVCIFELENFNVQVFPPEVYPWQTVIAPEKCVYLIIKSKLTPPIH